MEATHYLVYGTVLQAHWNSIIGIVFIMILAVIAGWLRLMQMETWSGTKRTEEQSVNMVSVWFKLLMADT